jgi:hypothetical protein
MMKPLFALAAILLLSACPADVYAPSIPGGGSGSLAFKLSAIGCTESMRVTFTVNGSDIGTQTLLPDVESTPYQLGTGVHTVRARTASGPAKLWPNTNIVIVAEATVIHVLDC